MLNHLVDIKNLDKKQIIELVEMAKAFKNGNLQSSVQNKSMMTMFFENSTRTKCSFELAGKRLGLNILDFNVPQSSLSKGESLKDTLENLYFIGIDTIVIRTGENGFFKNILNKMSHPLIFINAGEGSKAHPTQALLDFMTMDEKIGELKDKKITIIGDIAHSRVAKSNIELLNKFEADVHLCSPDEFKDNNIENATHHSNLPEAIENADVVMMLRVQKERHESLGCDFKDYIEKYQLNSQTLERYAPKAILMHPGPVNREIEITSELLDGTKGKTILEQAKNGVYMRMAILNTLLKNVRGK